METRGSKRKQEANDESVEPKRAKGSSTTQEQSSNPEPQDFFPLEQLPQELIWELLDWVPEAVPHLRAASRGMRQCVEEYAKQEARIQIVDDLTCYWKKADQGFLVCELTVPQTHRGLFELRMRARQGAFSITKLSTHIKRFVSGKAPRRYRFKFEPKEHQVKVLDFLNKIIGKHSRPSIKIESDDSNELPFPFEATAKLLDGIGSRCLVLRVRLNDSIYHLLTPTFLQSIGAMFMFVKRNTISDQKSFMAHLLLHTRHVGIVKSTPYIGTDDHFFGFSQEEWSPFIIDMVAHGYLKRLLIFTFSNSVGILNLQGSNLLRERIPLLDNNKVWLEISCDPSPGELDYKVKDYHVRADTHRLSVKHSSFEKSE